MIGDRSDCWRRWAELARRNELAQHRRLASATRDRQALGRMPSGLGGSAVAERRHVFGVSICLARNADFQSAGSQNSILPRAPRNLPPPFAERPADWKSAIWQIGNLRYAAAGADTSD